MIPSPDPSMGTGGIMNVPGPTGPQWGTNVGAIEDPEMTKNRQFGYAIMACAVVALAVLMVSFFYLVIVLFLKKLAKGPPSAAFCSPFGGGRYNCIWDRHTDRRTQIWDRHTDRHTHTYGTDIQTDAHTYGTDIQTDTPMGQTYRQTHMACEKQFLC